MSLLPLRIFRKICVFLFAFTITFLYLDYEVSAKEYNPRQDSFVFFKVNNGDMKIALSFDDGPHPTKTDKILDILEKYNVKATFFMVGSQAEFCPETARRVAELGHEIGNHTQNHKSLAKLTEAELDMEISQAENAITEASGYIPSLFRPPEGVCTEKIADAAKYRGYNIVMWSVDTLDWQGRSGAEIAADVEKQVHSGSVILMHDGIFRKAHTDEALEILIPRLLSMGYEFVTVGELISAYSTE